MRNTIRITALAASIVTLVSPPDAEAALAYAIDAGTTLVRFDTANPGSVTSIGNFSGAVSFVDGLDFRVSNGQLYGYSFVDNAVVTINVSTGATTFASTPTTGSGDFVLGIDFNPAADRLRLVNSLDQNLRINVDTGAVLVDGTLAYAAGDPNAGANPSIGDAAYTNNDTNAGTGTSLYYIDFALNTLVTTSNPNGGVLNTVGSLGVDANSLLGFDIFTDPFTGVNTGYAILDNGVNTGFYTINLATGAASLVGGFGLQGAFGLAVAPAAVPEPGTVLAGLAAFSACGATRFRRRPRA